MIKKLIITAEFSEVGGFDSVAKAFDEDGRQIRITTKDVQMCMLNLFYGMTHTMIEDRFTHSPVERAEDEE